MPGSVARNRQLLRQPRQRARGQHPRHGARRPVVVDGQPRSTGRPAGRRSRRPAARLRRSLVAALPMGYMRGAVAGGRVRNAGMAAVALGTPALVVGDTRRFIPERRLRHPRHRARVQHPRRGARGRVVVGGRPRWTVPSAGRQNAVRRGGGCARSDVAALTMGTYAALWPVDGFGETGATAVLVAGNMFRCRARHAAARRSEIA
jgi:hypothetical protein